MSKEKTILKNNFRHQLLKMSYLVTFLRAIFLNRVALIFTHRKLLIKWYFWDEKITRIRSLNSLFSKVKVAYDQEIAQSERNPTPKVNAKT